MTATTRIQSFMISERRITKSLFVKSEAEIASSPLMTRAQDLKSFRSTNQSKIIRKIQILHEFFLCSETKNPKYVCFSFSQLEFQ